MLWIKNRIFNTGLFLEVNLFLKKADSIRYSLRIEVKERFYTYPIPTGGLADRNFNEWWELRNHDLRRIDFGLYLKQRNLRGRNETLKIKLTAGFNKKAEIQYQFPYIDKKLKTGLTIFTGIILNRQVAFQTGSDILDYLETSGIVRRRYTAGFYFTRRNNFYNLHQLGLSYQYAAVKDTLAKAGPMYFLDSAVAQHAWYIRYAWQSDHRDFVKYAWKGYYLAAETEAAFFNTNVAVHELIQARIEGAHFLPLGKRFSWANGFRVKYSLPDLQGYFNQRALGYKEDYITGYELYVIDGTQFYMARSHLRWKVLSWSYQNKLMPLRQFKQTPFAVYLKLIGETGYVTQPYQYGPKNTLGNTWLYGWGAGIDFVTYYDIVTRFDYTINHLGNGGFYLHIKAAL